MNTNISSSKLKSLISFYLKCSVNSISLGVLNRATPPPPNSFPQAEVSLHRFYVERNICRPILYIYLNKRKTIPRLYFSVQINGHIKSSSLNIELTEDQSNMAAG